MRQALLEVFSETGRPPTLAELLELVAPAQPTMLGAILHQLEHEDLIVRAEDTGEILVVYPYSVAPTPHEVVFPNGASRYVMCAVDALGVHFMLNEAIWIKSTCPQTGVSVTVRLENGEVSLLEPQATIVWRTPRRPGERHDATTCCRGTRFFSSAEALHDWRQASQHPEGEILSVSQAADRGRRIFGHLLREDVASTEGPGESPFPP